MNYKYPQNLTLILSERKGVYINHNLKESQYFNTNKSFIKFFFKLLKGSEFAKKPKIEDGFIKIYNHEEAVSVITDNVKNSDSWVKYGGYSWGKTPKKYDSVIKII